MAVSFDPKMDQAGTAARANMESTGTAARNQVASMASNTCGLSFGTPSVSSDCGSSFNACA